MSSTRITGEAWNEPEDHAAAQIENGTVDGSLTVALEVTRTARVSRMIGWLA